MRILGLDLGSKRIGLALSDDTASIAFPSGTLERRGLTRDLAALGELIRERGVGEIVVGLPIHMDGRRGTNAAAADRFARDLAKATGLPVETLDERWTSVEAERSLRETGARRRSKGAVDEVAAAIILRTYLALRVSPRNGSS